MVTGLCILLGLLVVAVLCILRDEARCTVAEIEERRAARQHVDELLAHEPVVLNVRRRWEDEV